MTSNLRKWTGILIMVFCYYLVHEGAHCIASMLMGTFQRVQIHFPGIQVVADIESMSDLQTAIFCAVGALATLILGYILVFLTRHIVAANSKLLKAAFYYTTLGMLVSDPIYLSLLCGFFGGGDMNGIILFGIPELAARTAFGIIGSMNAWVFIRWVHPIYKANYREDT